MDPRNVPTRIDELRREFHAGDRNLGVVHALLTAPMTVGGTLTLKF